MEQNFSRDDVQKMIDDSLKKALAFQTKKYGDTPTDALQLTPKKYVTSVVAANVAQPGGPNKAIQFNNSSVLGGSPAFTLDLTSIPGFPVLTLTGTVVGQTPSWVISDGSGVQISTQVDQELTTSATPTTITIYSLNVSGTSVFIEMFTRAVRTGGSSGATGDSAGYIRRALFKNVSGTVTVVGSIQDGFTAEDQVAWDATFVISGTNIQAQFTGDTNNNITWDSAYNFYI